MQYWVLDENNTIIDSFHAKNMRYESLEYKTLLRKYPPGYNVQKSYCCCFTEVFLGCYIGQCCRKHDNHVGQAGTYNPITPHIAFYKCLKKQKVPFGWRMGMVFGGVVGAWFKQPLLWYKIYKYRKKQKARK